MDHKRKAENLGFSKEMMMISELGSFSGLFDDMGMSSSAIQDYSSFDDLEMLIRNSTHDDNNRDNNNRDVEPLESRSTRPPAPEHSEVVNTPNSCSISSSSTEAAAGNDDRKKAEEDEGEGEDQEKTKKQLSTPRKKKKKKKEREARFAFMTKSDVDHLDDGYRWRKYGQKAVKNSPFPRSYYRCTSTLCGVKKRVERSNEDPSTVVTTYEGMHTHLCPIMPRGSFGIMPEIAASSVHHLSIATPSTTRQMLPYQQQQQPYFHQNLTPPQMRFSPSLVRERPFCPSASTDSARDHGLLEDMLPSKMLKETKEGSRNQGFDEL